MRRSIRTAHVIVALSMFAPSGAAADDCMCMAVSQVMGTHLTNLDDVSLGDLAARAQSLEVGPFFSSDGSALVSSAMVSNALVAAVAELNRDPSTPLSEILWCWGPDDPRCAPSAPAPEDPPSISRTAQSATPGERPIYPPVDGSAFASARGELPDGARDGVRARVERPPRG